MKILFVRPRPSDETIGLQHVMIVEPLELEVLAALVGPSDIPVIVDMILERKPAEYFIKKENPDVFCVTGYITNVPGMKEFCRIARDINPGIITVAGGVHCEVCPDDLNDASVDYRVVRNATTVFPQLLKYLGGDSSFPKGVLRKNEHVLPAELPPFDFYFPLPDRHLTNKYRNRYFYIFYDRVALIKTSFGCPFSCNFCFCREITKGKYIERPLSEVINELILIKEKNIYIVDDDFLTGRKRVSDFLRAVRNAGIVKNYLIYGRADFIAGNPDLISEFKQAGLKTVIVGFESFYDAELESYNKNTDAKTNEKAMMVLNENKIDCYATVIIPPDWSKEDFDYCRKIILKLGIHYINLQPFTPLPGTGINVESRNLLVRYSDYVKWDLAHVTIRPVKMSVAEFYKCILELYHSILFQPGFMLDYLRKFKFRMMLKMITGSISVNRQYLKKIKEAKQNAENTLHSAYPV